jgi:hypothetical protein
MILRQTIQKSTSNHTDFQVFSPTIIKNVSRETLTEICCVAGLCRVAMLSYFLGNDATSVKPFYFVGYSQPLSWFFYPRSWRLYSRYCADERQTIQIQINGILFETKLISSLQNEFHVRWSSKKFVTAFQFIFCLNLV